MQLLLFVAPTHNRTRLIAGLLILLWLSVALSVKAQEASPSPTPASSPTPTAEEQRLIDQNRLLTLQKDNAVLRKDIRDAQVKPTSTPLAGTATVDSSIEVEMMSYNAMSLAAETIATEIKAKAANARVVAVYSAGDIKDWRYYKATYPAFEGRMNSIKKQYQTLLNKQPVLGAAAAQQLVDAFEAGTTALSAFVDVLAFFRTDVEIKGKDVTIVRRALVNELLRSLKNKDAQLVLLNPAEFPPQLVDAAGNPFPSKTLTLLGELYLLKGDADHMIAYLKELATKPAKLKELEDSKAKIEADIKTNEEGTQALDKSIETATAKLKKLKPGSSKAKALQAEIDKANAAKKTLAAAHAKLIKTRDETAKQIDDVNARIKFLTDKTKGITASVDDLAALNDEFTAFVSDFVKIDAATGTNPLTVFVKSENLDKAMEDKDEGQGKKESYWFEINIDKAGGNNRVRKNLIRFFAGPKVDHSGGVVVDYTLYRKTGEVVYSDELSIYGGYLEPKKIQNHQTKKFEDAVKP